MSAFPRFVIVGPGRMGLALGHALVRAEAVEALTLCGRRPEPPAHPLFTRDLAEYAFGLVRPDSRTAAVFLAVPDTVVPEMAHELAALGDAPDGCAAFHLSGALSTEVLAPLHTRGYAVGSFHPLQAIADPVRGAEQFRGSWIAVTGAPGALAVARRLAALLGSSTLSIPEAQRPLYHAGAVLVSGFLPPLVDAARRLLEQAGVGRTEALAALLSLLRGTVENIAEQGVEASLTGPISRGDLETVDLHLRALEPEDRRLYAVLALQGVRTGGNRISEQVRQDLLERLNSEVAP